jgi:predicted RNA-binding protein with PIN domain
MSVPEQEPVADPEATVVHLSEAVRARVLSLASDALGAMAGTAADEVPASLRPFARFTPGRRAKLAATPLATALELDPLFRQRVGERVHSALPELAAAVSEGAPLPAAPPPDVAALAYLLRPAGWQQTVLRAQAAIEQEERAADERRAAEAPASGDRQDIAARAEVGRLRAELVALRREHDELRRRLGEARERARKAEREVQTLALAADQEREAASAATVNAAAAEAEARRLRGKLTAAEQALAAARTAAREGRGSDDARLWLLLDTLVNAATGLRRELAVPPPDRRPADFVQPAGPVAGEAFAAVGSRGLTADDPALLDQLLGVPGVHLVVDGYNVTKTGYGALSLEAQRARLLGGVAGLAAQTGAETTVVFDGAVREAPTAAPAPRGVRLLFSAPGQIADDLIRELVQAEPQGRPVVVVSSDREVADTVRVMGARTVAAQALLRRLARG